MAPKITAKRFYLLVLIVLMVVGTTCQAQETVADSVDVDSEDFVTVSLVVSAPLKALYSVFGHATLRMECPYHKLDYIYTFESETNVGTFMTGIAGKAKAKYVAVPTDMFISDNIRDGREVKCYKLNLTPEEERNLWRILDQEINLGAYRNFNLLFTNCLTTSIINLERCLVGEHFMWGELRYPQTLNDGDLFRHAVRHSPWAEFLFVTFGGTAYDRRSVQEYRLTPETIVQMLRDATIVNDSTGMSRHVLTEEGVTLVEDGGKDQGIPVTPLMVFGGLLLLTLLVTAAEWVLKSHGFAHAYDIVLYVSQAIVGILMLYVTFFSELFASVWNWYLVVFLPLPLLFIWAKGKFARVCWGAYAIVLCLFVTATPLIGVLDLPHQLITATFIIRSTSRYVENLKNYNILTKKQ